VRFPRVAAILLVAALAVVILGPPYAVAGRRDARNMAVQSAVKTAEPVMDRIGPGRSVTAAAPKPRPCRSGLVALTYDDGPSPRLTPKFVRALQQLKMREVTFFMIGEHVAAAPGVARMVARAGFQIGNHTWDHPQLPTLSDAGVRWEIRSTARALRRAGLTPRRLVRPPYGAVDRRVREIIRSLDLHVALWTVDPRDWAGGTGPQIAARVLAGLRPHEPNVILDHDGVANSRNTLAAMPRIVHGVRKRGYCFTSLGLDGRPAVPVPTLRARVTPGVETGTRIRPVTIRLRLSRATTVPVTVRLHTADGTAKARDDYRAAVVSVRFPPGATTATVTIAVVDDTYAEPTESFWVLLDQPRRLVIDPSSARLGARITDDDPPGSPVVSARRDVRPAPWRDGPAQW